MDHKLLLLVLLWLTVNFTRCQHIQTPNHFSTSPPLTSVTKSTTKRSLTMRDFSNLYQNPSSITNPYLIDTVFNFLKQKNLNYKSQQEIDFSSICGHICNDKSEICSLWQVETRSATEILTRRALDQNLRKFLNPLPYIKSHLQPEGLYDLEVSCDNCQEHTLGSMCNICQLGYYDENRRDRIAKLRTPPHSELK